MKKNIKYGYYFITLAFSLLTVLEMIVYLRMYSNILGVIYLFINFFIFFMLFTMSVNYNKGNKNIRFSKSIIVIVLGIVSSFVVSMLVPYLISYTDSSYVFEEKIYVISKILKPILYLLLGIISFLDCEFKLKNIHFVKKIKNQLTKI